MASLKKKGFGDLSGRLGDLLFKAGERYTYVSLMPVEVKVHKTVKAVSNKNRFGLLSAVCSAMNRVPLIRAVWSEIDTGCWSNYNKQMKVNAFLCGRGDDISGLELFPVGRSFSAEVTDQLIEENKLSLTVTITSGVSMVSKKIYPRISAHGIMKLSEAGDEVKQERKYIPLSSNQVDFQKNVPLTFEFILDDDEYQAVKRFPERTFVIALAILNKAGEPAFFSHNISWENG